MKSPIDVLSEALTVFESSPQKWTRGAKARNDEGKSCEVSNTFATAFDLHGMIIRLTLDDFPARNKTLEFVRKHIPNNLSLSQFNDANSLPQIIDFLYGVTNQPRKPKLPQRRHATL